MLRCAGTSFQSPLHRGSLWNKEVRDVMVSEGTLSVPSSSGKSLEQSVRRMQSFGSFFFQSPLHRGSLWNKPTSKPRYTFHFSFSPLFIGEVSGTHELGRVNARLDAFQSPLHRGSLWNMRAQLDRAADFFLSVPSSSGKSLELVGRPEPVRDLSLSVPSSSGKSLEQLFKDSPQERPNLLSVPSSSGKSLERARVLCGITT